MSKGKQMKHNLTLVALNQAQSEKAKEINGPRKTITHALICGPHGQIFGTETYCRKYYSAWSKIFPYIFDKSIEVSEYDISDFETTFNLATKLIEIHDHLGKYCLIDNDDYHRQGWALKNFSSPFPLSWITTEKLCEDLECGWDYDEDSDEEETDFDINNVAGYISSCIEK